MSASKLQKATLAIAIFSLVCTLIVTAIAVQGWRETRKFKAEYGESIDFWKKVEQHLPD